MKIQKEFIQLTERQKREKWVVDRTKEIKEDTVKSLEPEIQSMLAVPLTPTFPTHPPPSNTRTNPDNLKTSFVMNLATKETH